MLLWEIWRKNINVKPLDFQEYQENGQLKFCFEEKEECLSEENIPGAVANVWDHLFITWQTLPPSKSTKKPSKSHQLQFSYALDDMLFC